MTSTEPIGDDETVAYEFWTDEAIPSMRDDGDRLESLGPMLTRDAQQVVARVRSLVALDPSRSHRRPITVEALQRPLREEVRVALSGALARFSLRRFLERPGAVTGLLDMTRHQLAPDLATSGVVVLEGFAVWLGLTADQIEDINQARAAYQHPERLFPLPVGESLPVVLETVADEAIAETVFRYQFGTPTDFGPLPGFTHYLALNLDDDPPERLVARLANLGYRVKPVSASRESVEGVFDRDTGERWISLRISAGEWIPRAGGPEPPSELLQSAFGGAVFGGDFMSGLGAHGYWYELTYDDGVWSVVVAHMRWIS